MPVGGAGGCGIHQDPASCYSSSPKEVRPSLIELDGPVPDLFMVSTTGMHSDSARELTGDAGRIESQASAADQWRPGRTACTSDSSSAGNAIDAVANAGM